VIWNSTGASALNVVELPVTPTPEFWHPDVAGDPAPPKQKPYQPASTAIGDACDVTGAAVIAPTIASAASADLQFIFIESPSEPRG